MLFFFDLIAFYSVKVDLANEKQLMSAALKLFL
jgi:hypothetical protein